MFSVVFVILGRGLYEVQPGSDGGLRATSSDQLRRRPGACDYLLSGPAGSCGTLARLSPSRAIAYTDGRTAPSGLAYRGTRDGRFY